MRPWNHEREARVHCGEMNRGDAMHCAKCGGHGLVASAAAVVRCAWCGRVTPNPQAYCGGCGRNMSDRQSVPLLERHSAVPGAILALCVLAIFLIPAAVAILLFVLTECF